MMTELCQELRNWFDRGMDKWTDETITIENGELVGFSDRLQENQYFRVLGSVFNDGAHKYGEADLSDETFTGSIWAMAVPPAVIALASDIEAWNEKYGGVDGPTMSPFTSESFGGYSYTKATGGHAAGEINGAFTWQDRFKAQLNAWRKIA